MNEFESTLAATLQAEAERTTQQLRTEAAADRLEARLERIDRKRRRRTWATVVAAAAVLVGLGVYSLPKIQSPTADQPITGPSSFADGTTADDFTMLVGDDVNGVPIYVDVTLYGAWEYSDHPVLSDGTRSYGGLAVYRPTALAAGTGCLKDQPNTQVGQAPGKLAQQLARLPRSTVLQSPAPTRELGRHAIHLQLRVDPDCGKGVYRVAETIDGGHGISYGKPSTHVVIDFWVVKVRGVPVVVETWHQDGASDAMNNEITRSRNSVALESLS